MTTNSEIQSNENKPLYMNDSTHVVYLIHLYCITLVTPCKFDTAANWSCHTLNRCLRLLSVTDRKPNVTCTSSQTSKNQNGFLPVGSKHQNGLSPSPMFTDTLFSAEQHNLGTRGTDK